MNRLPGCDTQTHRAEGAVFGALGLVAVVLVSIAVADAFRFASQREAIVAALERGIPAAPLYASSGFTNRSATNLAPVHPFKSGGGKVPARATVSAPEE
jgi:tRNA(Ile2) C34 agmatinyltransferase TiaS